MDAGDSTNEAEHKAGVDPSHIQVDSEVRIKQKQHSIKLEELPGVTYDDPDHQAQTPTGSEGQSEGNTAGSGKNETANARSWESRGAAKSEA